MAVCTASYGASECYNSFQSSYVIVGSDSDVCSDFEQLEGVSWNLTVWGEAYTKEYTANSLSIETLSSPHLLYDFTGTGFADVCNRTVRIPVSADQWDLWATEQTYR